MLGYVEIHRKVDHMRIAVIAALMLFAAQSQAGANSDIHKNCKAEGGSPRLIVACIKHDQNAYKAIKRIAKKRRDLHPDILKCNRTNPGIVRGINFSMSLLCIQSANRRKAR